MRPDLHYALNTRTPRHGRTRDGVFRCRYLANVDIGTYPSTRWKEHA